MPVARSTSRENSYIQKFCATDSDVAILDLFHQRCLNRILIITNTDHVTNEEVKTAKSINSAREAHKFYQTHTVHYT